MPRKLKKLQRKINKMQRGQVLVLVGLSAIVIIAIIGLSIDVGLLFIGNARLRRAVDAAALSAALQFRQGYQITDLTRSADEFIRLNGFNDVTTTVQNCDNTPDDPRLCTNPRRKLVRVSATADVNLAFLSVIGIDTAQISATATSEAASLDIILVIDRSESMTYGTDLYNKLPLTDPMRDPSYCNTQESPQGNVSGCEPFNSVINAAREFSNILIQPYDYMGIVTFDKEPEIQLPLLSGGNPLDVQTVLKALTVYQGEGSFESQWAGDCGSQDNLTDFIHQTDRCYGDGCCMATPDYSGGTSNYIGVYGPGQLSPSCPAYCPTTPLGAQGFYPTTNIGGGLYYAGEQLAQDDRQDVLWVVILLTDGVPNSGHNNGDPMDYFCPQSTWLNYLLDPALPICNRADPAHETIPALREKPTLPDGSANPDYDAADYAYDMADFVGRQAPYGQGALMYTIGLGTEVDNYTSSFVDPYSFPNPNVTGEGIGKIFLNYAAAIGNGQPYYTTNPADLQRIFRSIGTNIATRLAR